MRNPFKNYYYISFERYNQGGQLISKHFRMCDCWFWVRPAVVLAAVERDVCKDLECDLSDLVLTAINTI